jgi:hypothetical protein
MAVTGRFMSQLPFDGRRLLVNPFGRVVGDPLEDGIDVPEINREAFQACQALIEDVRAQNGSGALTLFGEAGTGKTHLLGRVRRWLQSDAESLFVPVRMDTSARMLWRHLRRNLADALLRADASGERALDRVLRPPALNELPERNLAVVLEHLLHGRHLRDAAAWLRGQDLPEEALARMEVAQPGDEENQEVVSRNATVSLCSLLAPGVVVICLDQWEALQSIANESDGLFSAGQAVSFLHDPPVRNVCLVCCVQTGFLQTIERVLDEAIRHRMLARRQGIDQLDWDKARRLIAARLDSDQTLAELRRAHENPLWPLSEAPIRQIFVANAAPARKVISRCKDLFDVWRTGELGPVEPMDVFFDRMLEERMSPVEPADTEAVLRTGLPVILKSRAVAPAGGRGVFDFSVQNGRQLVAICNQSNGTALASRVRKVAEAWNPSRTERLLVLRDARLRIGPTAHATKRRIEEIEAKGGRFVPVSQEAVEALAALRKLLADAQSGDLAYQGDPVSASKVEQWIADHLPPELERLLGEFEAPDPHPLSPRLADLVARRKVVSLEEAARELETRPEEVEACARRDPGLCGVLGGGTPALFQLVEAELDGSR